MSEERMATCSQHKAGGSPNTPVPSSPDLPFFRAQPGREFDDYYCGCWGWD